MCSGAIYWAKVNRIVYGTADAKNGYRRLTGDNSPFHPKAELVYGVLANECAQLMKDFFASKR
jgi:tRNA(adenine34) deaminase